MLARCLFLTLSGHAERLVTSASDPKRALWLCLLAKASRKANWRKLRLYLFVQ